MEYEIIREPFLFMETMDLLYKHVNRISFASLWVRNHEPSGTDREKMMGQRLELLQNIMDEVCVNLDGSTPALRYFFEETNKEPSNSQIFLAKYMISAFMDFRRPGFDETIRDILLEWQTMREKGAWLYADGDAGLQYTTMPGSPGNLFEQIYVLNLPAEFRLNLYGALHNFPETLQKLENLMRPVADKLQQVLARYNMDVGKMAEYWVNTRLEPLEFLKYAMGEESIAGAGNRLRLGISLINVNRITYNMEYGPGRTRDYSYMYIGCGISVASQRREHYVALDEMSTILRGLSERKRLEVLRQLAKKRLYGLELAEIMNMDRGNLSRLLSVLHEQGFLHQEKENQRTYYRADREGMQKFFDRVVSILFD